MSKYNIENIRFVWSKNNQPFTCQSTAVVILYSYHTIVYQSHIKFFIVYYVHGDTFV